MIENSKNGTSIDLVLMDLNMPLKDGFETGAILIQKVRKNYKYFI